MFPLPDHVVDAINEFCSQDVHIRFGDKQVYRCRAFLDRLCMDGAEVAAACLGNTRNCLTCWCPKSQLADTDCCHPLRKVSDLLTRLDEYRDELLDEEGEPFDRCIGRVGDAERELRHKLWPKNAWLRVKFFELFSSCPKDELHQWYLGLFGEHIIPAIFYRYEQALLDENGDLILSNASMEALWQRLADRLQTVVTDTSMLTLSPEYAAHFHDIYVKKKEGATYTGDRMKMLMLTLPFMVRDLIAPEVIGSVALVVYSVLLVLF